LKNYISYPHINVVGSVITGSHGGGIDRKSIATFVSGVEYVDADGNIKSKTRNKDSDFEDYIFSFGMLGVVTRMKMDVIEAYDVRKCIYTNMNWDKALYDGKTFNKVQNMGDFMSYFTDF
jgi:xylitol oxidase